MDPELADIFNSLLERQSRQTDMVRHILYPMRPYETISPGMVRQCLRRSKYWQESVIRVQPGRSLCISLAQIKSSKLYVNLLRCIFLAFPQMHAIDIWHSEVDERVFEQIRRDNRPLRLIRLTQCNIGQNMGRYLSMINLEGLRVLVIQSEAINNKSLTTLMKNQLPSLRYVCLRNTNLTTDSLKTLKKLNHALQGINFCGHQRANLNVFLKQVVTLLGSYATEVVLSPFYSPQDYSYVGWLAKKQSGSKCCFNIWVTEPYCKYNNSICSWGIDKKFQVIIQHVEVCWIRALIDRFLRRLV